MKKECAKCNEEKERTEFGKANGRKDGLQPYCKQCRKGYASKNKDKLAKYHREYRGREKYQEWLAEYVEKNKEYISSRSKKYRDKLKAKAFCRYGGYVCACCGETEEAFLAIDHINGGDTQHRKEIAKQGFGGNGIYYWLRKNNYPKGFQVLCHNCNWGKYVNNGICPHKENNNSSCNLISDRI